MRPIYTTQTMLDRICDICYEADKNRKELEFIEVTEYEALMIKREVMPLSNNFLTDEEWLDSIRLHKTTVFGIVLTLKEI